MSLRLHAGVAKQVDAPVSETGGLRPWGSTRSARTHLPDRPRKEIRCLRSAPRRRASASFAAGSTRRRDQPSLCLCLCLCRPETGDTITRNERVFLNLPGFHGGGYVLAYVEDTSERGLARDDGCDDPACTKCPHNFEPRIILELADCNDRIELWFEIDSEARRANSLHKVDTLLAALRVFRKGLVDEFEPYDRRERELEASRE
jgi:hypothetical protein